MIRFTTVVAAAMLAIFTAMVVIALGYPDKARFMPLVVGLPGIALCLVQLTADLARAWRERREGRGVAPALDDSLSAGVSREHAALVAAEPEFSSQTVPAEIRSGAYFAGFIAGVLMVGFHLAVPVLVTAYLTFEARVRPFAAATAALVFTLAIHLMFERLLGFSLHDGFVTLRLIAAFAG